jgi:para-aminobenzoate synthetase component I
MEKHQCIETMNRMAANSEPFWFAIDFDGADNYVLSPEEANCQNIFFEFKTHRNFIYPEVLPGNQLHFFRNPVDFSVYKKAFETVQRHLCLGDSYLVNLTFQSDIDTNLSLKEIFLRANAPYKLFFDDRFVVFSPETFVQIKDGTIRTFPMKGTIDASIPGAQEKLLANQKELAEHATIVDLLRNDLSRVATEVRVEKFRYIDTVRSPQKTLLQVSSEIVGKLPTNYLENLGSILFELLPAGSVTGAPKKKTVEIIKKAEGYERGFYTGISGYFDGKNLDSCVLIRFIEKVGNQLVYKSGGGITSQSILEEEYQELIDKIYVPIN